MKKKVFTLILALFAIATTAQAQVVLNAENFPDANFRSALAEMLEINEGDEITAEKIAATTELNVNSKSIATLTGIEHFTALTKLECGYNQLTSLDVSNNTALTLLRCHYNQLASLDVTKNTELDDLDCSGNQLTVLDVSQNTALIYLWCNGNQLISLDVSNNIAMKRMQCSNNQLTSLNVSQNTALIELNVSRNIALQYLVCTWKQLTSLDVSGCTALTFLNCDGNQLTSLNVSGCTALITLSCGDNKLTTLNLSGCNALTSLSCYGNQIKGEAMEALVASLPTVTNGDFHVINTKDSKEQNVITTLQVAVAKGKGWTVKDVGNNPYSEYEGSDNSLSLGWVTAYKGTQITLPISLENDHQITGIQFDLYLPDGVTVATNSKGKMLISTTERMDGTYSISSNLMDGCVRILGYSADSDAFTGNSGDILNITLNIDEAMDDGDYTIHIKDIVLSDVKNTEFHPADATATLTVKSYTLGDVDNSGAININDVVCIINYILNKANGTFIAEAADVDGSGSININDVVTLINRFILHRENSPIYRAPRLAPITDTNYLHLATIDLKPGETKEVEMILTNDNTVSAAQGNIKLPEGLSFVTKSNGRVDAKNINDRSEDFTLSCAIQDDGSMTFAHYSADGYTYEGSEGGIFTFKLKADENAVAGSYHIALTGVVLSINGVGYDIADRTSTVTIGGTTGINSIDNRKMMIDNWYSVDGKKLNGEPTKSGLYIHNGKMIVK